MRSRTYIAIPPGSTIKECLSDRLMTQKEFALRMNMSEKHISKLIHGTVQLTDEMAYRLELVLDIPAEFWMNLEAVYRKKLIMVEEENSLDEEREILKYIPYREMVKLKWIDNKKDWGERILQLRKYFEIVSLKHLNKELFPDISFRKLSESKKSEYSSMAWAQKIKIESRKIFTKEIDVTLLIQYLPEIRSMTRQSPDCFLTRLIKILSDCGIALVVLPHLPGSALHGATFDLKKKIILGMTVRGKDADIFWFSLFHELGHIIYKLMNISDHTEDMMDDFAKNLLIPEEKYKEFTCKRSFDKKNIIDFADSIGIDSGIVVGRLQKDEFIPYSMYNELKKQYVIQLD